jgi:hypothetical protein
MHMTYQTNKSSMLMCLKYSFILLKMNSTFNNKTVESWFIPLDVIMIMCTTLSIIFAPFVLIIIITDKRCHTVPMMLVANSYLTALILGCGMHSFCVYLHFKMIFNIFNIKIHFVFFELMLIMFLVLYSVIHFWSKLSIDVEVLFIHIIYCVNQRNFKRELFV